MKNIILIVLSCLLSINGFSQENDSKKEIGHKELIIWNQLTKSQLSSNGKWITYELKKEEGDGALYVYNSTKKNNHIYKRGSNALFDIKGTNLIFKLSSHQDSIRVLKKRDAKEEDFPKDTLCILELNKRNILKIPNLKSFAVPSKWDGWLVFQREPIVYDQSDSTVVIPKKKESKKNGTTLSIRNLESGETFNFPYVKQYQLAEEGKKVLFETTGDSTIATGIHLFDCATGETEVLYEGKGKFKHLTFHELGKSVAFLVDRDTGEAIIRPFELMLWEEGKLIKKVANNESPFLKNNWIISQYNQLNFSENDNTLFFGVKPAPEPVDTTLLEEEKAVVEVWRSKDERLFPQQVVRKKQIAEQSYLCAFDLKSNQITQLGDEDVPGIRLVDEGNAPYVLGYNDLPYLRASSWEGFPVRNDTYIIDIKSGERKSLEIGLRGRVSSSPKGNYLYWYNHSDTTWNAYEVGTSQHRTITNNEIGPFYDERNDRPMLPYPKGVMGWSENDTYLYIYDEYDIWRFDMTGMQEPVKLTNGRNDGIIYRYVRLDKEERWLDIMKPVLVRTFNERNKQSGYGRLDLQTGAFEELINGDYQVGRKVLKAKEADTYIITKESYTLFPNLLLTNSKFKKFEMISDANPQQNEYKWGNIELVNWTSTNGKQLQGMLAKPDNFDPRKQYPMIVNFYERSSDGLHYHRAPYPHRSTINYTQYTSNGYLVFNPDVIYENGYPGESAEDCVLSGISHLIDKGFVDKDRIGGQGHSWGGYQVAHLVTVSDVFACVESGAPVVNMTSAYGGIRWGSGLSRMFQYEHTQSRIGGTLWDKHLNYIENSPIFRTDKINTPLLILHNDKDGAVPWYQGIEWFVALRRLDKPAWMLNYNNEPHWPVKLANRKDFNNKMKEFFDYYLKDTEMPEWME